MNTGRVSGENLPVSARVIEQDGGREESGDRGPRPDARAAHRRRIAVLRRGGGDRRCRRVADLPRLVVPAAGRRLLARGRRDRRAGMEPPLGRLAGGRACGDRLLRARHPARRPVAPRQSSRIPPRARRRRSRRAVRVEGPGHGRPARRHVPQSSRARAHRVPGGHLRGPAAVVAGVPRGVRRGAGGARDGLVRAVLRPHDRERAARHRPRRDLRARRDRARDRRPAREPAVAGVAQSRRADAVAAACRGIQRRSRLAPALAGRPASHRARSGDARRRRDRGRGGRAVRRAGGRTRRAARERRTRARCVVGGQPARSSTGRCSSTRGPTTSCSR